MPDNTTNNKRIAKNTMILYVRMIIMTLISLYTARIVLSTLGFENYGIYQVVGGVVVLFSFLNNGLSSASNRYITAEIAKNDTDSGQKTFNVCLQAHLLIALVVLIIAETVGLWIVNNILEIPEGKTFAANVGYQFSVVSFSHRNSLSMRDIKGFSLGRSCQRQLTDVGNASLFYCYWCKSAARITTSVTAYAVPPSPRGVGFGLVI